MSDAGPRHTSDGCEIRDTYFEDNGSRAILDHNIYISGSSHAETHGIRRIAFPAMGDGRGFSIARRLRAMGYRGVLRAKGPLVADQARAALSERP